MIKITDKTQCSGCTACQSVCSHDAITMIPDTLGFLYPVVDKTKCIQCGLCDKVCSFHSHIATDTSFEKEFYYMRHVNHSEMLNSRSGAAFIALSDAVLESGGVIYGVSMNYITKAKHIRATDKDWRDKMRGSKYIQGELDGIFQQVRKDLDNNKIVMFTGLPCQIAGLKAYLGKRNSDKLFLVDILCHGAPAPYIWRDYVTKAIKKFRKKVVSVSFRDKRMGWYPCFNTFNFEDGTFAVSNRYSDIMYHLWIFLRMSCKVCPFANVQRPSDLTIGDGWYWRKTDPEFNADDKGVSLIVVHTAKGKQLFELSRKNMDLRETDFDRCKQEALLNPVAFHPKRENFEKDYSKYGYNYVYYKYIYNFKRDCINVLLNKARRVKRHLLKTT